MCICLYAQQHRIRCIERKIMSTHGKTPTLRVIVDRGRCCGYGLCAQLCPEVYKLDENGLVYVESELIPGGLEEEAREGAAACPAEALVIEAIQS
jgi:ferredoxin